MNLLWNTEAHPHTALFLPLRSKVTKGRQVTQFGTDPQILVLRTSKNHTECGKVLCVQWSGSRVRWRPRRLEWQDLGERWWPLQKKCGRLSLFLITSETPQATLRNAKGDISGATDQHYTARVSKSWNLNSPRDLECTYRWWGPFRARCRLTYTDEGAATVNYYWSKGFSLLGS